MTKMIRPRSRKRMSVAPESAAVARSRKKLEKLFAEQKITPEKLEAVKGLMADQIARSNAERVPVPGKDLSLFSQTKHVKLSGKVQSVMDRVKADLENLPQTAPVALNG